MTTPESEADSVRISIDGLIYRVGAAKLSGADVRRIPHPPIPPDRDLWLVDDHGTDRALDDRGEVELVDGIRLVTAPRSILAG